MTYVLTEAAETDLRGIIRYTRKQWGHAQVCRYILELEQGILRVASRQEPFKDLSALFRELRILHRS